MAGDRQAPSGTVFDLRPQFQVHEVVRPAPLAVTGRCLFAPVADGTVFSAFTAPGLRHPQAPEWCRLRVEEIRILGRRADELDQAVSARLVLSGRLPPELGPGSVLIGHPDEETGRWRRAGILWVRAASTVTPEAARND